MTLTATVRAARGLILCCVYNGLRLTLRCASDGTTPLLTPLLCSLECLTNVVWLRMCTTGDLDLVLSTGKANSGHSPNQLWLQVNGIFVEQATSAIAQAKASWSDAIALGDLDNDGDLDVLLGDKQGGNQLYFWQHCGMGVHEPGTGNACKACPINSVQAALTDARCMECPEHMVRNASGVCAPCPPGLERFAGAPQCGKCLAGWHQPLLGTKCAPCSPGEFSEFAGSVLCFKCALGSFAAGHGQQTCDACDAGSFSSAPGALYCTPCPLGEEVYGRTLTTDH